MKALLLALLLAASTSALASAPLPDQTSTSEDAHARLVSIWNRNLKAFGNTHEARSHAVSEIGKLASVTLVRLTQAEDGIFVRFKDGSISGLTIGTPRRK